LRNGSVALLADLTHNVGDAPTALPVGIAFLLRPARAEKYAAWAVVLAIAVSMTVAGATAVNSKRVWIGRRLVVVSSTVQQSTPIGRRANVQRAQSGPGPLHARKRWILWIEELTPDRTVRELRIMDVDVVVARSPHDVRHESPVKPFDARAHAPTIIW